MSSPDIIDDSGAREAESNLKKFHAEASSSAVESAGNSFQSASLIAVGAASESVALLSVFVNLILAFLCIKAPAIAKRIGPTRKVLVVLACLNTYGWAPIILLLVFIIPKYALLFLGIAWLINLAPSVLIELLRDSWLANLIPSDQVGRYLGKRMAITSIFYLGTFLLMGYMLDNSGLRLETSFAAIFTIAFVASLASFFIYSRMHDLPLSKENNGASLGFSSFLTELRDKKLSRFTLFVSLFRFTVNFVGPLYAVYMLNELHFSYSTYAIVISAEYLSRITTVRLWGRLADRVGNIKVISLVSRLIPILPILWLFSHNALYLALVQMVSGACWAAFDLCNQGYIYKVAPASKKILYVVYSRSVGLACVALGGLFGVYLLKTIPPLGGSQIPSIFLLSGVFRLAVAALLLHQLIDYALPLSESGKVRSFDIAAALRTMARKVGLYYHPEKWGDLAGAPVAVAAEGINPGSEVPASNLGLYHQPKEWQDFAGAAPEPARTNINFRAASRLAACQASPEGEREAAVARTAELSPASVSTRAASRRAVYQLSPEEWEEIIGIAPKAAVSPAAHKALSESRIAHYQLALQKRQELAVMPSTVATQKAAAKATARMAHSKRKLGNIRPPQPQVHKIRLQPAYAAVTV